MGIDQPLLFYDEGSNKYDEPENPVRRSIPLIHMLNPCIYIFRYDRQEVQFNFGKKFNCNT